MGRKLVEWDMPFNNQIDWGDADSVATPVFDHLNIAVHELGHALGLVHPDDSCAEESMYRFASLDETKKRDINAGDIAGLKDLYGD